MNASAAAPALAKEARHTVAMRLADPAIMLANVSLIFAVLLIVFPSSFPHLILKNWQNASLTPMLILLTVALNLGLYLRVAAPPSRELWPPPAWAAYPSSCSRA